MVEETEEQAIQLPPKYYLTYFEYMLGFVQNKYGFLLASTEVDFLERFAQLTENAKCLYIRLSNRRGTFFKWDTLRYDEIGDLVAPLYELSAAQLVGDLPEVADDATWHALLALFTKAELLTIARALDKETAPLSSIKRPDLVRWLMHTYSYAQFKEHVAQEPIISVLYQQEVTMLKYLFFGNRYNDMSEFVIRDLGHVRFQTYEEEQLSIQFTSRQEVEDRFMVSLQGDVFEAYKKELPPEEIYDWFMNWQDSVLDRLSAVAMPAFQKLALKVATWLEKNKLLEQALGVYDLTDLPPARERRVRLLQKIGLGEEAKALAELLIEAPQNAEEKYFAIDFLAKLQKAKKKPIKSTTRLLNAAESVEIDVAYRHRVERGVLEYYSEQGYEVAFCENEPWKALFGLVFWDSIYDMNVQAIHHPLQRIPSDFFQPDFYYKRHQQLTDKLNGITSKEALQALINTTWEHKLGLTNVLVGWYEPIKTTALQLCTLLSLEQLKTILLQMARNMREHTRGFPDLLIWKENEYWLIEVKSPTDHLSARQLYWLELFASLEVSSKVLRVVWKSSPVISSE